MDGSDHSKETPGWCSRQQDEIPDDKLYELYCEYAKASRAAMLRVTVCPESRKSISEGDPVLGEEDFLARVHAMTDEVRCSFLRRVTSGYEVARLIYREELLREFRPVA